MENLLLAVERLLLDVSPRIYLRGKNIKEKNLIELVYKLGDLIKAYVKSENNYFNNKYKVLLIYNENDNNIKQFHCECPYHLEYGDVCKHIVSVLLYIKEVLTDKDVEIAVDRTLESLSPEEKNNLLKDLIIFNQSIQDDLVQNFNLKLFPDKSKYINFNEDMERKYKNLFKQVFNNLIDKIVRYREWYIEDGIEDFETLYRVEKIYNDINTDEEKFIFLKIFFKSYLDLIYLDEDTFYNIDINFLESFNEFFTDKFKEVSTNDKIRKKVLEFICREINFNIYPEFYEISVFKAILEVLQDKEEYKILYDCLKFYNIEDIKILSTIYKILDIDKYLELVKNNKYTSSYIQKEYIDYLLKVGAPKENIKHFLYDIKDSIKSKENLKYFLKLDKDILDLNLIKIFYRKLILDFYELEYLKELKALIKKEDWKYEFLKLEKKLSKEPFYLIGLYIFEDKLDYAIKTLKKLNYETLGYTLIKYMKHFKSREYIKDFVDMLYKYIVYTVNNKKNRDNYRRSMEYLEKFLKYPEFKGYITDILNKLKEKYPKRYALQEEIENFLKRIEAS